VNLSTKVHGKGSRRNAQAAGFFCNCEPCEPCEPCKSKLLKTASQPHPRGLHERAAEPSDPSAKVLGREGSQAHKVHNMQEMPIPWAFPCEPSRVPKVHSLTLWTNHGVRRSRERWQRLALAYLPSSSARFHPRNTHTFQEALRRSGRRTIRGSLPGNSLEPFRCYILCGQIVQAKKDRKRV